MVMLLLLFFSLYATCQLKFTNCLSTMFGPSVCIGNQFRRTPSEWCDSMRNRYTLPFGKNVDMLTAPYVFVRLTHTLLVQANAANDWKNLSLEEEPTGELRRETQLFRAPTPPRRFTIQHHRPWSQCTKDNRIIQGRLMIT